MKYALQIKMRFAYVEFKRRVTLVFSIWTLAFIAGIALILFSEFVYQNITSKVASVVLAFMLFTRILYDVWKEMREEYEKRFRQYMDSIK
jgi:hypothetical protein